MKTRYLQDFEEEEDVEEEEGMPKEVPSHHTAKASAAKPDANTDSIHAPADQMSDISTDSSIVSEQKMELKPLPPSFVRPPRAVVQQSTKEEVLSATSEEYSDYDDDHEDAASPQPLPSVAQRQVTSRVNIPPALGSTTMDEIDDILDSTMEETPTGGTVARGTTNQGAVGKLFGRGATADEEEVEDDDVSFFSDPESSIGEESRKGQQPKGKTGVVHKTVKPPQTVAKQPQKAAAKAQSSSGSSLGLSSTSSEQAVSSNLSRSPSRSLPPGSRRIHRQETGRSSLSILPLEEENQYDVEGASIDFDLDDEDIAAQLSMDINSASTTPQRPKTAASKQAASSSFRKPAQQPQTRQQTQLQHSITSEEMGMTTADLEEALASENDESEEYGSGAGTRGGGAYQQSTGYRYTRAQSARYDDNSSYNGGYGGQYDNYGYDSRAAAPTSYGGKSGYGGGRQGSLGYAGAVGSSSYQRTHSTRY
ncbi:hypothetical protein CEUSTIGMA_g12175.t1 [Chlamydomonas eustigma]|uniref:Uncharacterized protein n=1 Tax=Chlamydomonas eustigma TaxID=1157962 RepID=A0A250XP26_9CHLO|nr:hypothetical protein CEUSTIGMA_g12175.t1 [Chlamydomonas eustigma]|eukprot:GAX84753.1 hypothetical protein CEUSTIGMA_g12175.t1 [Chlamydomonas eustigma]